MDHETPLRFAVFAMLNPEEAKAAKPSVTNDYRTLRAINAFVNAKIKPRREASDVWSIWPEYGDCDDYAVTKRHELVKAGIPSGALRLAIGTIKGGEAHCVLLADTGVGTIVLDNRTSKLKTITNSGIRFTSWATSDPMKWEKAKGY